MSAKPSTEPDARRPDDPADSGLHCLRCDYNLTGLTGHRCPECGTLFDPHALHRILAGEPEPIPGWNDRGSTNVVFAFFRICWDTWFHPTAFAIRFPWACTWRSAAAFGALTRLVALGVFWGGVAVVYACGLRPFQPPPGPGVYVTVPLWLGFSAASLGAMAASSICEAALAFLLEIPAPRLGLRRSWQTPFDVTRNRAFVMFHGTFLLLTAATCGVLSVIAEVTPYPYSDTLGMLSSCAFGLSLLWWWYCLGRGIAVRYRPAPRRLVVIALIPIVGLVSAAIGAVVGFYSGFFLFAVTS